MRSMLPMIFVLSASACSSAAFDVAGDSPDTLEGGDGAIADVEPFDGSDAGAGDAPFETGPEEVRDSTPGDDTAAATDTGSPVDTAPADAGCPLRDHYEPVSGTKYTSCLASGIPGDGSTYSSALFADELAHCDAATPSGCSWGSESPIACGAETCTARPYSCPSIFDGGVAWSTWCTTGSMAGWITGGEGVGRPAICPTTDSHGAWW